MRTLQIVVPEGRESVVVDALEEAELTFVVTDETSHRDYGAFITVILPQSAVEETLELLDRIGIDERSITIISDAEAIISRDFDEYREGLEEKDTASTDRIAREELLSKAHDMITGLPTYATLTVVSAVIATVGLLLNSPATVVGSMVIAPLIGPAMAASVGTVVADRELFHAGLKYQAIGIGLAVVSATVFAFFVRYGNLVPPGLEPLAIAEVNERAAPNFLILVVALGAGIAGVISLMTGVSAALVGVMIAVALLPPAAAVGIGIAFFVPQLVIGAGVLVLVNVLSINLAALLVLWRAGYRPAYWFQAESARISLFKQAGALVLVIAVLSLFLGGVTYDSYVAATTEEDIRTSVTDELEAADESIELVGLEVERSGTIPPLVTEEIVVTVGVPPGEQISNLSERIRDRIREDTGIDAPVRLQVITIETAG